MYNHYRTYIKILYIVCLAFVVLVAPVEAAEEAKSNRAIKENKHSPPLKTWFHLAEQGQSGLLQELYECCDIDINITTDYSTTALHICAEKGYLSCVKYLVKQGANITLLGRYNKKTALMLSVGNKHLACVKFLNQHMLNCMKEQENSIKSTEKALQGSGSFRLIIIQYWQRESKISEIEKDIMSIIVRYGDTEIQQ